MSKDRETDVIGKVTADAESYNLSAALVAEKTDAMCILLDSLCQPASEFDVAQFKKELADYREKHNRLFYSEITIRVQKLVLDSQTDGTLLSNVDAVCDDLLKTDPTVSEEDTKIMLKLHDHVNLVINQTKNTSLYFKQSVESVDKKVNVIDKKYQELDKGIEAIKTSIYSQLISIVAIFVAISFVMFGGMSMMNNLLDFSNMTSVPMIELIGIGSLIGVVMLLVIYMFLNFMLYLTKGKDGENDNGRVISRQAFWVSILALAFAVIICTCISRK